MYKTTIAPNTESVLCDMRYRVEKWFGQGVELLLDEFTSISGINRNNLFVSPFRIQYEGGFNQTDTIYMNTYVSEISYLSFEIFQAAYQDNELAAVCRNLVLLTAEGRTYGVEFPETALQSLYHHYISPQTRESLYHITPYQKRNEDEKLDMRLRLIMRH